MPRPPSQLEVIQHVTLVLGEGRHRGIRIGVDLRAMELAPRREREQRALLRCVTSHDQ